LLNEPGPTPEPIPFLDLDGLRGSASTTHALAWLSENDFTGVSKCVLLFVPQPYIVPIVRTTSDRYITTIV